MKYYFAVSQLSRTVRSSCGVTQSTDAVTNSPKIHRKPVRSFSKSTWAYANGLARIDWDSAIL
jgi:hypothetical protein